MDLKYEDAVYNLETVYAHMQMSSDNNFQVTKLVPNGLNNRKPTFVQIKLFYYNI